MKLHLDSWLAAAILALGCVEVSLRSDLPSRPAALLGVAVVAAAVLGRRHRPLLAMAAAFGLALAMTLFEAATGVRDVAAGTQAALLLLPYTVARRGSARDVWAGAALIAVVWLANLLGGQMAGPGDAVGAAVVLLFPGAIGAVVRFRDEAQERAVGQARLLEREGLARELHDSVAHHLVAITLQSQAAQAVLAARPAEASRALAAIEDESRRTLAELRSLVGSLRDDGEGPLAPAGRIADLPALALRTSAPQVGVTLEGDLSGLEPAVERAVYRLAQESITNALKHARNARKVELRIAAHGPSIHLSARDDGDASGAPRGTGFGLVGMAERAALLGGTFEAGPLAGGGWQVAATLPRLPGGR